MLYILKDNPHSQYDRSLQHTLSCQKGGFVSIRHNNNLLSITAKLLEKCCNDEKIEPTLQSLTVKIYRMVTSPTKPDSIFLQECLGITPIRIF